jgi:hypothetical protein
MRGHPSPARSSASPTQWSSGGSAGTRLTRAIVSLRRALLKLARARTPYVISPIKLTHAPLRLTRARTPRVRALLKLAGALLTLTRALLRLTNGRSLHVRALLCFEAESVPQGTTTTSLTYAPLGKKFTTLVAKPVFSRPPHSLPSP